MNDNVANGQPSKRQQSVRLAHSFKERLQGLFAYPDADEVLLIYPCNSIHTCFMTRPIHVAFLDAKGMVLSAYKNVHPFRWLSCKDAWGVLEGWSHKHYLWFEPGEHVNFRRINSINGF